MDVDVSVTEDCAARNFTEERSTEDQSLSLFAQPRRDPDLGSERWTGTCRLGTSESGGSNTVTIRGRQVYIYQDIRQLRYISYIESSILRQTSLHNEACSE
jgi:hypothetical protein